MIEKQDNNYCANSGAGQDSSAQLVDINCANPKTALQGRLCLLMSQGNMPRQDGEKIYTWGNRIGLPGSTLKRILSGSQSMQRRVAGRLNITTGASIEWLISGIGQPFDTWPNQHQSQTQNGQFQSQSYSSSVPTDPFTSLIDIETLTVAIRTAERALEELRRTMSPEKKAVLIAGIYELYSGSSHDEQTMQKTIIQLIRSAA